jgi:ketoreductase RED1
MTDTHPDAQLSAILDRYKKVTVIGAGVIGTSWTALFLACGLCVTVNDPRPDLAQAVMEGLKQATPALSALGLPTENLSRNLRVEADLARALDGTDFVQENGPERVGFKQSLFATVERLASPDTLLLSSSSGLRATDIAQGMTDAGAGRLLIGHPFNPPHVMPLVEIVPGERTAAAAVADAVAFYAALGKKPLVLRKEVPGFVANRLQAALFRECIHLVRDGVVTLDELDTAVTGSIGLRWATGGPFLSFHLGGGPGGLPAFMQHLGPGLESLWTTLGEAHFDEATVKLLTEQDTATYARVPYATLVAQRDQQVLAILNTLAGLADTSAIPTKEAR